MTRLIEKISDAITQLIVGPRVADSLKGTLEAHKKANQTREEINQIIRDAELVEKAEQHNSENNIKDKL